MIPIRVEPRPRGVAWITWLLIAANCLIFWKQVHLAPAAHTRFIEQFGLIPAALWQRGNISSLLTSAFLHGSWLHLIGNMLTLWVFGPTIEARLTPLHYLAFYLSAGIVSALGHAIYLPHSTMPCVGASGAIAGVLGAFLFVSPRARVVTLVPFIVIIRLVAIPAFFFLAFWFASQILLARAPSGDATSIAFMAHIAGFLYGGLGYRLFLKRGRSRR